MSEKKWVVDLSAEEREELLGLIRKGKAAATARARPRPRQGQNANAGASCHSRVRSMRSGVIETLLARRLIEDDPRFGRRGRPSFLGTTADFLRSFGLGSLAELPPRPVPSSL